MLLFAKVRQHTLVNSSMAASLSFQLDEASWVRMDAPRRDDALSSTSSSIRSGSDFISS